MKISKILCLCGLLLLSVLSLKGADLLAGKSDVSKWHAYGGATVVPGSESGLWLIKTGKKGTESGFYAGGLKTENGEYVLKVRARVKSGYLKLVMKHGDNTYGLLSKNINVSGDFKEYEFRFTETKGGNKSSAWLVVTGEAEVYVPTINPVEAQTVAATGKTGAAVLGADLLAGKSDVSKWHAYGGATVVPGSESGLWLIKTGKKGTESGFYAGGLKTENGEYVLKVRAKVKSGYLKLLMKHGDNTYGLLSKNINVSGDFKEYEFRFTETKGGNKSSAWLVVTGEAEVYVPTINPVEAQTAAASAEIADPSPGLGADLLAGKSDVSKWYAYGGATVVPGGESGLWLIKTGKKGTESGFYAGGLKTENGEYVLKVRARVKSGYLKLVMKHGDNTYGLLGKSINVSGGFKEYEFRFTETKGGNKSSAWLVVTGEAEVYVPTINPVKAQPAATPAVREAEADKSVETVLGDDLLAGKKDVSKWSKFGGAVIVDGAENGIWSFKSGKSGTESGCYTGLKIVNGEYLLKVRARVKSGYLKVMLKHGNNSYGLLNERISPSGELREYEFRVTEASGGSHGSVWLVITGEAEAEVPTLHTLVRK